MVTTHNKYVAVPFSPEQVARLRLIAQAQGESVTALIRRAIEDIYLREGPQERLAAVQQMAALSLPVADWEQMERESVGGCSVE